jgi:dTDP-4-amino-4,6-dideoxygalactose transaminase
MYDTGLQGSGLRLPLSATDSTHVYHAYVVRHPRRDSLRSHLKQNGIATSIHYPVPVHLQPGYKNLNFRPGSLPVSEAAAREALSLPLFPGMREEELRQVVDAITDFQLSTDVTEVHG